MFVLEDNVHLFCALRARKLSEMCFPFLPQQTFCTARPRSSPFSPPSSFLRPGISSALPAPPIQQPRSTMNGGNCSFSSISTSHCGAPLTTLPKFAARTDAVMKMPRTPESAARSSAGDEGRACSLLGALGGDALMSQLHCLPRCWSQRGCRDVCCFIFLNGTK